MGRFKSILAGPRQRKTITLPFPGARYDAALGKWEGHTDQLDVRALRSDEYDDVVSKATAFARAKGVEAPADGDELYERGRMLHTLIVSCIDKDSPLEAPIAYFESVDELQTSDLLLPETIAYLFQQQRMWQDEISPLRMNLSEEEYLDGISRTVQGDTDFFVSMRPGLQWSSFASMASQLVALKTRELQRSSQAEPASATE
jgi:hypothetical protein